MSSTAAILYLVASVLFILALKGLSSPESARRGNTYGIVGMVIAVLTTLSLPNVGNYGMTLLGIAIVRQAVHHGVAAVAAVLDGAAVGHAEI